MAAFDHNGVPGSALDRELRGLNCTRCDRLSSDLAAREAELAATKQRIAELELEVAGKIGICKELKSWQWKQRAEAAERKAEEAARVRSALEGLLAHCDNNPEGETDFERAVIAARAAIAAKGGA